MDVVFLVYTNRQSFRRAIRRRGTAIDPCTMGAACFTYAPIKRFLPIVILVDGTRPLRKVLSSITHECVHAAQGMFEHYMQKRLTKKACRHEFEAYLATGLSEVARHWANRGYVWYERESAFMVMLFQNVDMAFDGHKMEDLTTKSSCCIICNS